jgi:ketosteroid isomerase-like protein
MDQGPHPRAVREMLAEAGRVGRGAEMSAWLSHFTEDVEWISLEDAPDAGVYTGHDGIRRYFEDWLSTVDRPTFEIGELHEVGDSVVAETTFKAKVKGTEHEVAFDYWLAFRFDHDKLARLKEFREREDAFSFAGA